MDNTLASVNDPKGELHAALSAWSASGLTPLELEPASVIQSITMRHDPLTGQFTLTTERLDALQTIGLLVDAIAATYRDMFQATLRPPLNSGNGKVCIQLDGDALTMAFGIQDAQHPDSAPIADAVVAKGMMVAALFGLCRKTLGEDFDAMDALLGRLLVRVTE